MFVYFCKISDATFQFAVQSDGIEKHKRKKKKIEKEEKFSILVFETRIE